MSAASQVAGPDPRRTCEVRPSWSAREWSAVSAAAAAAGMPPAVWCARLVSGGLDPGGESGPGRCTTRGVLWGQLLERWQSVSWGLVAVRGRVPPEGWAQLSHLVGRGGVMVTSEAERVPGVERRQALRVCQVATQALVMVGPGTRASARRAARADQRGAGHRAKVLLRTADHQRLREACGAGRWLVADYVGALTSIAAFLALADPQAGAEVEMLAEGLAAVRAAADTLPTLIAADDATDVSEQWARLAEQMGAALSLIEGTQVTGADENSGQALASLVPDAIVGLGWAAAWGVVSR